MAGISIEEAFYWWSTYLWRSWHEPHRLHVL